MWIAAKIEDTGIGIYWQRRSIVNDGVVTHFNYNGEVESESYCGGYDDGGVMVLGGVIPLTDDVALIFGSEYIDKIIHAICIHAVELILHGYGESIEEVVGWFSNLESRAFIVNGEYIVKKGIGTFTGLKGHIISVEGEVVGNETTLRCVGVVGDDAFEFTLADDMLFDFMVSCYPN